MENLKFYPTLTEEMLKSSGCTNGKYSFSYFSGECEFELKQKGSTTVKLTDPLEMWKIEDDGIALKKKVCFAYPEQLHGESGIACSNAEIGICIIWTNHELTQTGCILPATDITTGTGRVCEFSHSFKPGELKGDLELSLSLYIKKKAEQIYPEESSLMNEEGVSIGEIETIVLDFNSAFMEFPIEECISKDEPLWWVEFSQWEDPKSIELFSKENICLYLNPYYPACPMTDGTIKNPDLLIEILSMAYFMMFQRLSSDDLRSTCQGIGLAPFSICSILHDFKEKCNSPALRFDSSEMLLKTLQMNIRAKLMEGDE
ncbi:hypothetical protein QVN85_13950 [Oscillibacter valericigenes]|nr:hypothetical protein [Oscillibacter valericigenes]